MYLIINDVLLSIYVNTQYIIIKENYSIQIVLQHLGFYKQFLRLTYTSFLYILQNLIFNNSPKFIVK